MRTMIFGLAALACCGMATAAQASDSLASDSLDVMQKDHAAAVTRPADAPPVTFARAGEADVAHRWYGGPRRGWGVNVQYGPRVGYYGGGWGGGWGSPRGGYYGGGYYGPPRHWGGRGCW